ARPADRMGVRARHRTTRAVGGPAGRRRDRAHVGARIPPGRSPQPAGGTACRPGHRPQHGGVPAGGAEGPGARSRTAGPGGAGGGKGAMHDRAGTLTWAELDERANRFVHVLEDRGVEPGDRVALLLRNGRELAEALVACQKVGVIAAPLNTWAKPAELRSALE